MKLLIKLLLIFPLTSFAAVKGQITDITIHPSGWFANVTVFSMATNGTAAFGFGTSTNNTPATSNFLFTVTSPGFGDTGVSNSNTRYVIGTHVLRVPTTNYNNVLTNGVDSSTVPIALSDYIYNDDTVTANVVTNWYTDSTPIGNIATNAFAVVNSSTQPHPRVIGGWAWPPHEVYTNSTYKLYASLWHRSGQQGRPIRAVKFWSIASDGKTNEPVWVTTPTKNTDLFDPTNAVVTDYEATMDNTAFNSGKVVTNFFAAYPWIGNSGSVLNNSTSGARWHDIVNSGPYLCITDRSNTYGQAWCRVDATNGTSSGLVVSNYTDALTAAPFQTLAQAVNAVGASNNLWWSRNAHGNSFVMLTNGSYVYANATYTARSEDFAWLTFMPLTGVASNNVFIYTNGAAGVQNDLKHKYQEVTLSHTNNGGLFQDGYIWLDRCWRASNGPGSSCLTFSSTTNDYMTRCIIDDQAAVSFKPSVAPGNNDRILMRGNTIKGTFRAAPQVLLGNRTDLSTNVTITFNNGQANVFGIENFVWAFNLLRSVNNAGDTIAIGTISNIVIGGALIGNVLENTDNASGALIAVGKSDNANAPFLTNVIVWHNSFVGQRILDQYNEISSHLLYSVSVSFKGNVYDDYNTKHDLFSPQDSARTNRWTIMYSVGRSHEAFGNLISGDFTPESDDPSGNFGFNGIYTQHFDTNNPGNVFMWTSAKQWVSGGDSEGNGNYQPQTGSVLIGLEKELLLPYDLNGTARYTNGAIGAIEFPAAATPAVNNNRIMLMLQLHGL